MTEKIIIFDASTLISFAMNGLLHHVELLKKEFSGRFIITKEVKYEIVERPLTIKRFELEALQINELIEKRILEMPSSLGINDEIITKETNRLLEIANSTFHADNKPIHLIDLGEASCLALGRMLNKKKIPNLLAIDERTTRLLSEKPDNLKKLLTKKHHRQIRYDKKRLNDFNSFKIIRSCELAYLAYQRGLMKIKNKKILDAVLYALKFKGCSISTEEIEEIKRMR